MSAMVGKPNRLEAVISNLETFDLHFDIGIHEPIKPLGLKWANKAIGLEMSYTQ